MAKIYYNQRTKQFEVTAWNPATHRIEIIDSDVDFDALGTRQGFLSEEDEDKQLQQLLEDFGALLKN